MPENSAPEAVPGHSVLHPRRATGRVFVAGLVGVLAAILVPAPTYVLRGLVGWDSAAVTLIAIAWMRLFSSTSAHAREFAAREDPGRTGAFAVAVGASAFSLLASIDVLGHARAVEGHATSIWSVLALLAVVLSWVLTHTMFTLRYAHLYYTEGEPGGLEFPGGGLPDDVDFAYFAFTIGMCFQVSDVVISSSRIRLEALIHALTSFVYNTVILALSLNLVFSLLS